MWNLHILLFYDTINAVINIQSSSMGDQQGEHRVRLIVYQRVRTPKRRKVAREKAQEASLSSFAALRLACAP